MSKKNKRSKLNIQQKFSAAIIKLDDYQSWLFLTALFLIPLLVRIKVIDFIVPNLTAGVSSGPRAEMLYLKSAFMIFIVVVMLLLFLIKLLAYRYEITASKLNPLLFLLTVLILLSLLGSDYKTIALMGNYSTREGGLVFLSYLALFFIASHTVFPKNFVIKLNLVLAVVVLVNLLLGVLNSLGINLYDLSWVKWLVIPGSVQAGSLENAFTLGNMNFISGLFAALALYFLVFAIYTENLVQRLLYALITLGALLTLVLAQSSSGFAALLVSIPVLLILLIRKRPDKNVLIASVLLLVVTAGAVLLAEPNPERYLEAIRSPIEDLKEIPTYLQSQPENVSGQTALDLPALGLSPGTGRLYIWSKTISLMKERPVLGYGPDTISYYFPQYDRQKRANLGNEDVMVDKIHNFYLSIAFACGIPAALLLLALVLIVLYKIMRLAFSSINPAFPAAVMLFSLAYLLQWFFNDSISGSAVIYWSLAGMALGCSDHIKD